MKAVSGDVLDLGCVCMHVSRRGLRKGSAQEGMSRTRRGWAGEAGATWARTAGTEDKSSWQSVCRSSSGRHNVPREARRRSSARAGGDFIPKGATRGRENGKWNWILERLFLRLDRWRRTPLVRWDESGGVPGNSRPGPGNRAISPTSATPSQESPQEPFWRAWWNALDATKMECIYLIYPLQARLPQSESQLSPLEFLKLSEPQYLHL